MSGGKIHGHELHALQSERQTDVLRFRITPSLKRHIEAAVAELGVGDFSAFARGALLNAIELAKLSRDPKWREFLAAANAGPAKAILGHGLALPAAGDIEGLGRERQGLDAKGLKAALAHARKKGPAARARA